MIGERIPATDAEVRQGGESDGPAVQGPARLRGRRIAHLIETDGPGGAERVVALLATRFQEAGARNVVFLPADGEGWLEGELSGSGVEVDPFRLERPFSPRFAFRLARRFREHGVEIAHSHEFAMAFYGAVAARAVGIPHFITMHGGAYYDGAHRRRLALRIASGISRGTVAVSEPLGRALVSRLGLAPGAVHVVPNGIRPPADHPPTLRAELGLGSDARLVVSVGNLYPVKGHRYLIEAMGLLAPDFPKLHLAIAGRGDLHEPLQRLAEARGVANRLHLLGLRGDVSNVLASADVFCHPSLSEGLPLAILEAMFAGRPIVASAVGEVPQVLGHGGAGLLVPPESPAALAAALRTLLSDADRARSLGLRARQHAFAHFSVDRMADRYAELYTELGG